MLTLIQREVCLSDTGYSVEQKITLAKKIRQKNRLKDMHVFGKNPKCGEEGKEVSNAPSLPPDRNRRYASP